MKNDVTIDEETADLIWHPKIDFLNVLTVENPTGFGYKNTHEFFAYDTNRILMAEPLKIKVSCNFNFLNFPFDYHECDLTYYEKFYESMHVMLNATYQGTIHKQSRPKLRIFFTVFLSISSNIVFLTILYFNYIDFSMIPHSHSPN